MKKYLLPLFGMAVYFTACEDELAPVSGNSAETVTSFSDLSECNKNIIGKFVYVSDSVKVYACTDNGWAAVTGTAVSGSSGSDGHDGANGKDGTNGKDGKNGTDGKNGKDGVNGKDGADGKSCTMTAFKDGTGFDVICDGKSIGTVKNGTDGAKGKDGKDGTNGTNGTNGKDGTSCSVAKAENSDDVVLTCGKESVTIHNGVDGQPGTPGTNGTNGKDGTSCSVAKAEGSDDVIVTCGEKSVTIHNGVDGQPGTPGTNGTNGKDGSSCKIASDKDGVVQLQCGEGENAVFTELYKAMCGTKPYDPKKSFCTAKGEVYELCDGETYDTQHEFCYENEKYDYCGSDRYNPTEEFCVDNKLHTRCNGEKYNLTSEFCVDDKIYDFCAGGSYNPSEKFCNNNKLYDLCGGTDYNPLTHQCKNGAVVEASLCGDIVYDPDEEFCAMFNGGNVQQVYKKTTITIKSENYSRTWMAENLNYEVENSSCYRNISSNCDTYGRLYTWAAAVGRTEDVCGSGKLCVGRDVVQGICPEGWHLPSRTEWEKLFDAVGGAETAVTVLRSKEGWQISNKGTDNYGFTVLPGGEYIVAADGVPYSDYYYMSIDASFWMSNSDEKSSAYGIVLNADKITMNRSYSKDDRFSVRCIKDLVTE